MSDKARILIVDDEDVLRVTIGKILTRHGYEVSLAASVTEALRLINTQPFDVLLSDLHMPGPGDGFTVIGAMRHSNPHAVTFLVSAFPDLDAAADAVLLQADEILVKPMNVPALVTAIERRLAGDAPESRPVESVADVFDRSLGPTLEDWLGRLSQDKVMTVGTPDQDARGAMPEVLGELLTRLHSSGRSGPSRSVSQAAITHGRLRRQQGYSVIMLVREFHLMQKSLFHTLEVNLNSIDYSLILLGVTTIADELNQQLGQSVESFFA